MTPLIDAVMVNAERLALAPTVAKPRVMVEKLTADGSEEVQVTRVVMFCVEPSLNVAVAVNCCVLPC